MSVMCRPRLRAGSSPFPVSLLVDNPAPVNINFININVINRAQEPG